MGLLEDFIRRSDATLLSSDNLLFKSIICVGTKNPEIWQVWIDHLIKQMRKSKNANCHIYFDNSNCQFTADRKFQLFKL